MFISLFFDIIFNIEGRGGNVRSNKGQALLEFVLILPVFMLFFLAIIDVGKIIYEKNRLEGIASNIVDLINAGDLSYKDIESKIETDYQLLITLNISNQTAMTKIKVSRSIDVITPGLGIVIENPYTIDASRVIYEE